MPGDAGSAIAPDVRIDTIPGMPRGNDARIRGIVLGRADAALVDRVRDLAPPAPDGHAAPIYVLDPDSSLVPCSRWGARVRIFRGSAAVDELLADRRQRLAYSLPECVATVLDGEPAVPASLVQGLVALSQQQSLLSQELSARLAARWRSRGMAHWRSRFSGISKKRQPASVLVITSRYSTFVRHSADDLVRSLQRQGHNATLFLEADDHETLTSIAYLEAIERHDPDLIVAINFPRWAMGGAIPQGWPYVCWVQDAMQHLFQGQSVAGPLDFVVGHVYRDAMARAGYNPSQLLDHPVCVSESKFHREEASPEQRSRYACDIGYVSHRSETPEAFVSRFLRETGLPAAAHAAIDGACREIDGIIARWPDTPAANELPRVATDLARTLGRSGDARATDILGYRFVRPYAEQRLRHETLEWAAEIAVRHAFSMRLFGHGWESHPVLGRFAAGPLAHGEDLRECYQLAACQLHASIEGCGHQRVAECAMSGGLPLCRRSWAEFYFNDWQNSREFVIHPPPPDLYFLEQRWPGHVVADHPDLLRLIRERQRMLPLPGGWDHVHLQGLYAQIERPDFKPFDAPVPPRHARSLALFGDPIEATFSTREELEDRILKAVARGSWRAQISEGTARRAVECVGASNFAARLVRFVADAIVLEEGVETLGPVKKMPSHGGQPTEAVA
ncbi:MAG: hypothetical protein K2Y21_13280 [Phycisphaerales bacterium]|nr:hypothetical protein [Phycisphaerales bacterium]